MIEITEEENIFRQIKNSACLEQEDGVLFIYSLIDDLLQENRFDIVDSLLDRDLNYKLPTLHLLAILSITSAAKDKLKNRSKF